jgi:hypothetical protein
MNISSPMGFNEAEYIIDQKRGVVVNTRNMDTLQNFIYKRNQFKTLRHFFNNQRPDLSDFEYQVFRAKFALGENYLNEVRKRLNSEITRLTM